MDENKAANTIEPDGVEIAVDEPTDKVELEFWEGDSQAEENNEPELEIEEEPKVEENAEVKPEAKPKEESDLTKTQAFSKRLNEKVEESRKKDLERIAQLEREQQEKDRKIEGYRKAAAAFGYTGDDQFVTDEMLAKAQGKTTDEYRRERQAQELEDQKRLEELIKNSPAAKQIRTAKAIADLSAIKAVYPFVTASSITDLGAEFLEVMDRDPSTDAVKAFEQTHIDDVVQHKVAAARQAARNQQTKSHLNAHGSSQGTKVTIPTDTLKMYRKLNPHMTDSQIARHYAKSLKESQKGR